MKKGLSLLIYLVCLASFAMAEPMRILVMKCSNTGNGSEFDWLAAGIQDSVINDLKKIKDVVVITAEDRRKALKELAFQESGLVSEDQQLKIGKVVGANVVLTGSYTVMGDKLRILARLVKVESTETLSSTKVDGEVKDIFSVQDRIVVGLIESMNAPAAKSFGAVSLSGEEKKAILKGENGNFSAYEFYSKGLDLESTDLAKALTLFEKAIALDGAYVEALERAVAMSRQMSDWEKAKKHLSVLEKATREKHGEKSAAMADYYFNLGSLQAQQGNYKDAEKNVDTSLKLRESLGLTKTIEYGKTLINRAMVMMYQGKYPEAQKIYLDAKALVSEMKLEASTLNLTILINLASLTSAAKKYKEALAQFDEASKLVAQIGMEKSRFNAMLLSSKGETLFQMKENEAALDLKKQGLAILKENGLEKSREYAGLLHGLAYGYYATGKKRAAAEQIDKCLALLEELDLQKSGDYQRATALANLLKK